MGRKLPTRRQRQQQQRQQKRERRKNASLAMAYGAALMVGGLTLATQTLMLEQWVFNPSSLLYTQQQISASVSTNAASSLAGLAKKINNENEESFCISWNTTSKEDAQIDSWWTHHPTWEVSSENLSGYCFSIIANSRKKAFIHKLHENQFHNHNCSNILLHPMKSSGWGADSMKFSDALLFGLRHGRPASYILRGDDGAKVGVWHYAGLKDGHKPVCNTTDILCYMLPHTNCRRHPEAEVYPDDNKVFWLNSPDDHNEISQFPGIWIYQYIMRQQTWLRRQVYSFQSKSLKFVPSNIKQNNHTPANNNLALPPKASPSYYPPCTALHVRRGDILGHGNRRYHAIGDYLTALDHKRYNSSSTTTTTSSSNIIPHNKTILLLTDSSDAIDEATQQYPQHHWMYTDRIRFRSNEGGWENHFASGDPKIEVIMLLAEIGLVQRCNELAVQFSRLGEIFQGVMRDRHGTDLIVADIGA